MAYVVAGGGVIAVVVDGNPLTWPIWAFTSGTAGTVATGGGGMVVVS